MKSAKSKVESRKPEGRSAFGKKAQAKGSRRSRVPALRAALRDLLALYDYALNDHGSRGYSTGQVRRLNEIREVAK